MSLKKDNSVLIVCGSPRKGGNTDTLASAVATGVVASGGEVEVVRLCDVDIGPCIGCGGCDKTGKCVVNDDMQEMYDRILAARRIVVASPIYFYSVSAQTKAFIDRIQALWSRKQLMVAQNKWQINSENKGFLISVAATRGKKIFEGAKLCVQYAYDAMGFNYCDDLLVRGMDGRTAVIKDHSLISKAEEFGKRIVLE